MRARRPLRLAVAALLTASSLTVTGLLSSGLPAGADAAPGASRPAVTLSQDGASQPYGASHTVTATAIAADGSPVPDGTVVTFGISAPLAGSLTVGSPVVDFGAASGGTGGWLLRQDGSVTPLGTAPGLGDAGRGVAAAVALAVTPSGGGYWLAAADGAVRAFGDAAVHELAAGAAAPVAPIVDIVATHSGQGYWLLTASGVTVPYGDAKLSKRLTGPKGNGTGVAMVPTPSGAGYWVLRADGVVVAYGDAVAAGDPSYASSQSPMVGITSSPTGKGYWVASAQGSVYSFGDAINVGSPFINHPPGTTIGVLGTGAAAGPGPGYWVAGRDGSVYPFGNATGWGDGYRVPTIGGRATLQFSSSVPGRATVTASLPDGANGRVWATALVVIWHSGPPAVITLSPTDSVGYAGNPLTMTATVLDAGGFGVDEGTPVTLTASGTGTESPATQTGTTYGPGGQVLIPFTSTTLGRSTVTATAGGLSATTTVNWKLADLSISLYARDDRVSLGSPINYTAGVYNSGRGEAPVTLTFALPAGPPPTLDRGPWSCASAPGTLTCRGSIPAWGSSQLQFHLLPSDLGTVTSTATVAADAGPDEDPSDNVSSLSITVEAAPGAPELGQTTGTETIGHGHTVAATTTAAPDTLLTFGLDGPATPLPGGPWTGFAGSPAGDGYWLASGHGQVIARGSAPDLGGADPAPAAPVVDLQPTPTGNGYWLVTADGTVIPRGDATDAGSLAGQALADPIVGMAVTGSGDGYWLADSAGGIHPFGDAHRPKATATAPAGGIVDIEGSPAADGFWLLGADGSVQAFDVPRFGDRANFGPAVSFTALTASPTGSGYWLSDSTGNLYPFGDARYLRTDAGVLPVGAAATTRVDTASSGGVWSLAADGSILSFGTAPFLGPITTVPVGSNGQARLIYTATHTGSTAVTAALPGPGGPVTSAPLPTEWTPADAGQVTLSPTASAMYTGRGRRMSALVRDASGFPVADGTAVSFAADGAGGESPASAAATTVGGRATFTFTAGSPGRSTVTVTTIGGPLTATATVQWRKPPPRPVPPAAPQYVDASAGDGGVEVMWGAPDDEGSSPITRYTVTAAPGGRTVTAGGYDQLVWVDGLDNGTSYVFTITAWNDAAGPGPSVDIGPMTPRAAGDIVSGAGDGTDTGATPAQDRAAYWMLGAGGAVYAFGTAEALSGANLPAGVDAVDLEPRPTAAGYWILDSHGVVHPFGDAESFGDADLRQFAPGETPASLSSTPSGKGYWVFSSRGRALPFGDARFFGDMSKVTLNGPVLDSIPTPSGNGYYMVANDGGIFAFGDARFAGSMGGTRLNAPVRALVPDGDGAGYWLVAADGGIFAFDAGFRGSMGATKLNRPITGMVRYGNGYLMAASDGGVFSFSDLPFAGSLGASPPSRPIVALAAG